MATLAASSDSSQLVSLPSPSPKPFRFTATPSSIYSMGGDRFGSLPFSSLSGCSGSHFCIACAHAVTVVGTDFALPLLQVQRGKHMGFSRYPPTGSFCLLLPPHLHFSLLPSQHMPAVFISHIRRSSARPAFPVHASMDSWTLRSRNQTAKPDFPHLLFFSDATVDLSWICFSATHGGDFGRYSRFLSSLVQC